VGNSDGQYIDEAKDQMDIRTDLISTGLFGRQNTYLYTARLKLEKVYSSQPGIREESEESGDSIPIKDKRAALLFVVSFWAN